MLSGLAAALLAVVAFTAPALPADAPVVVPLHVVHARLGDPELVLSPDNATLDAFTMVDAGRESWPTGCLWIGGAEPTDVCGRIIFDTGSRQCTATTTAAARDGDVAGGTSVRLEVGAWSHAFDVGPGRMGFNST